MPIVACLFRRRHFGQPDLASQRLLNVRPNAPPPPQFVLVALESARNKNGVERKAVGRGEDLRVDDVAARGGSGPSDASQEPWVVRRDHSDRSPSMKGVGRDLR